MFFLKYKGYGVIGVFEFWRSSNGEVFGFVILELVMLGGEGSIVFIFWGLFDFRVCGEGYFRDLGIWFVWGGFGWFREDFVCLGRVWFFWKGVVFNRGGCLGICFVGYYSFWRCVCCLSYCFVFLFVFCYRLFVFLFFFVCLIWVVFFVSVVFGGRGGSGVGGLVCDLLSFFLLFYG